MQLFDPNGVKLAEDWTYPKARIDTLTLPSTGSYAILASDQYGPWTGGYGLSLQRTVNPLGAAAIVHGDTVQDSIVLVSQMDAYTFSGTSGDTVNVHMTRSTGTMSPYVELFDQSGQKITEGWGVNKATINTVLPSTGAYAILASDYTGYEGGDYDLSLLMGVTGIDEQNRCGPSLKQFRLSRNHPNPFTTTTTIHYMISEDAYAVVEIYDVAGHKVRALFDGHRAASNYSAVWDGRTDDGKRAASGIYLYRLKAGHFASAKRMVLLK